MAEDSTDQVSLAGATDESEATLQLDAEDTVTRWLRELKAAEQHERDWREKAEKVVDLYKDQRKKSESSTTYRFNILFANTEVLKGAMYSQCPVPDIRRRHLDKDPVSRLAAMILTRATSTAMDLYDFDGMMRDATQDMVLPGRGQARVKYKPTIEDGEVTYEAVECCYVPWEHFRYSPAKRWEKVRWVAYAELLTRDDLKAQFPDVAAKVDLKYMPPGMEDNEENKILKRALVWTIFNKPDKTVYVITEGYKEAPLKVAEDPLKLEKFFPSCKPIYAIQTTNSLIPVPEYVVYQDHAIQLDELNERIAVLTDALRRRGVYDASIPELSALKGTSDNEFIPVKNYREFMDKGGLEQAFQELEITGTAEVLAHLMQQAELKKQQIYEIIGISDLMRGTVDPKEKLGQSELKSQYGSIRVQPRQQEVQRFARDNIRLMAEIIAEHFSPRTLAQMTGINLFLTQSEKLQAQAMVVPGQQADERSGRPTWEEIMSVLRSDHLRGFKIDIETDSTIRPQADEEQKNRVELLTAITSFGEKWLPAVQMGVVPKKLMGELLSFGVRGFKVGPQIEEMLDEWTGGVDQEQQQQNPELMRLQAENRQLKAQADENTMKREELGFRREEIAAKRDDRAIALQADREQRDFQREMKRTEIEQETVSRAQEREFKGQELAQKTQQMNAEARSKAADNQARAQAKAEADSKQQNIAALIERAVSVAMQEIKAELRDALLAPRQKTLQRDPKTNKITGVREEVIKVLH